MRTMTFCLFIAISLFSLACGFYDLYKNVPFLNALLKNVVGNMYLPFVQWLEEHTKVCGQQAANTTQHADLMLFGATLGPLSSRIERLERSWGFGSVVIFEFGFAGHSGPSS
jgi:hypothetical protein